MLESEGLRPARTHPAAPGRTLESEGLRRAQAHPAAPGRMLESEGLRPAQAHPAAPGRMLESEGLRPAQAHPAAPGRMLESEGLRPAQAHPAAPGRMLESEGLRSAQAHPAAPGRMLESEGLRPAQAHPAGHLLTVRHVISPETDTRQPGPGSDASSALLLTCPGKKTRRGLVEERPGRGEPDTGTSARAACAGDRFVILMILVISKEKQTYAMADENSKDVQNLHCSQEETFTSTMISIIKEEEETYPVCEPMPKEIETSPQSTEEDFTTEMITVIIKDEEETDPLINPNSNEIQNILCPGAKQSQTRSGNERAWKKKFTKKLLLGNRQPEPATLGVKYWKASPPSVASHSPPARAPCIAGIENVCCAEAACVAQAHIVRKQHSH
ncbi:hypothetical protein NDU88_000236 [Pleurodeles waltl]|uniref:Uncharacterized protein n=1 Tax=Pleurodeles waltl TaxID=8319 RepID=A0AAV7P359_PLEWA|nr:hypothetical protein NDU88_000236 [Pleurodeles waltl]